MLAQSGVTSQPLESASVPCGRRETPNAHRLLLWCKAQMMISFRWRRLCSASSSTTLTLSRTSRYTIHEGHEHENNQSPKIDDRSHLQAGLSRFAKIVNSERTVRFANPETESKQSGGPTISSAGSDVLNPIFRPRVTRRRQKPCSMRSDCVAPMHIDIRLPSPLDLRL